MKFTVVFQDITRPNSLRNDYLVEDSDLSKVICTLKPSEVCLVKKVNDFPFVESSVDLVDNDNLS